jgi:hypothetical protein
MVGIEPTPSKSNDWTPLSPCQLGHVEADISEMSRMSETQLV